MLCMGISRICCIHVSHYKCAYMYKLSFPLAPDFLFLSRGMRFRLMWYVQLAKPQISLGICAVWSEPLLVAWMTKHQLECLSAKVYTCQNATLLDIAYRGSFYSIYFPTEWAWCFGCLSGPPGFTYRISFAPVFSLIYCWVLILALSPCYILIYMF